MCNEVSTFLSWGQIHGVHCCVSSAQMKTCPGPGRLSLLLLPVLSEPYCYPQGVYSGSLHCFWLMTLLLTSCDKLMLWSTSALSCSLQGQAVLLHSGHLVKCRFQFSRYGVGALTLHSKRLQGKDFVADLGPHLRSESAVNTYLLFLSIYSVLPLATSNPCDSGEVDFLLSPEVGLASWQVEHQHSFSCWGLVTVQRWTWSLFPEWSSRSFGNFETHASSGWLT